MLSYLRGKIKSKSEDYVVLEVLGIGFKVFCSKKVLADLPLEKETELLIYLYKTQTVLDLYGFTTKEEKDFFEVLVDLPSIGPKAALIILSAGPVEKIKEAISAGNEKYFENVPGIGKKRVQKVILELSGKLNKEAVKKSETNGEEKNNEDIIGALINLGVSRQKSKAALLRVPREIEGTENIIREALKFLGR